MEEQRELNSMCLDCERLGGACGGEYNPIYTGCVYKDFFFNSDQKEMEGTAAHEDKPGHNTNI